MTHPQVPTGAAVVSSNGELLGHVSSVYTDNATGHPAWIAVTVGADHIAVAPLEHARFDGQVLHVPFDAAQLHSAPHHDPASLISYQEGDDLARHYGLIPPSPPTPTAVVDTDEPTDDTALIRSEEQLRFGTMNVAVGRARLVTYIITEDQTFTIPVSRQEVRLEYDPLPTSEQVPTTTALTEETHEVICYTEQVQFTKQVVPTERVRMHKRVITTTQTVTAPVRSEQVTLTHHAGRAPTGTG